MDKHEMVGEAKATVAVLVLGMDLHKKLYALPLTARERLRTVELLEGGLQAIKDDLRTEVQTEANASPPLAGEKIVEPRTEQAAEEPSDSSTSST